MDTKKVLVVDDKQAMRDSVGTLLQRAGYQIVVATNGVQAIAQLHKHEPAAVISDYRMPEMDGMELLRRIHEEKPGTPMVLMTAYASVDAAVSAMKFGAFDFIQKPFEGDELVKVMQRAIEHGRSPMMAPVQEEKPVISSKKTATSDINQVKAGDENPLSTLKNGPVLVGQSQAIQALTQLIERVSASSATVLITGESGTGKEVVARCIHARSQRVPRPFMAVNCAALSSTLLESELFGHEKGAFTGADQMRKGRFELAHESTLLLDEISEVAPEIQAKLLRVLQERQFERVGSSQSIEVDVRVLATSNRDLKDEVLRGTFRQDLFYRLNVVPLKIPPLRERVEDIPLLANHFLTQLAAREKSEVKAFDDKAMHELMSYHWPGNVREMHNICERASVMSPGKLIGREIIQDWLAFQGTQEALTHTGHEASLKSDVSVRSLHPSDADAHQSSSSSSSSSAAVVADFGALENELPVHVAGDMPRDRHASVNETARESEIMTLEDMERQQILRALKRFDGNRKRTASALGIGVRTLGLKLKKWKEMNLIAQTV